MNLFSLLGQFLEVNAPLSPSTRPERRLYLEQLEEREVLSTTTSLLNGVLTLTGDAEDNRIVVRRDLDADTLVVTDRGQTINQFNSTEVQSIVVDARAGNDWVRITSDVFQDVQLLGGDGNDLLEAGSGTAILDGGTGRDKLYGGYSVNVLLGGEGSDLLVGSISTDLFDGGPGNNSLLQVQDTDTVVPNFADQFQFVASSTPPPAAAPEILTVPETEQLLDRASAATSSNDAIIVVVGRDGTILGVRVEDGVDPAITLNPNQFVFAVDGAIAKARTAAFFATNAAPLTSRTIEFLSQTTVTQREVESNPNITDPNSTERGPGFVAPVQLGGHFPPGIPFTPAVDLFGIEHTNRDSILHVGPDQIKGTADDVLLAERFNIDPNFVPAGKSLVAPESYGFQSGVHRGSQARGIGTLPGGLPIFKNGELVGGIGVFFPGTTGFATEENSILSTTFDPTKPDRSVEAEYIGFAALGGSADAGFPIGALQGVAPVEGISLPFGRIDLVGITLDVYGPQGNQGPKTLVEQGRALGEGPVNGSNAPVAPGPDGMAGTADDIEFLASSPVPDGWLVTPHDGVDLTAADVERMIVAGIQQAEITRAAIRLPLGSRTRMVFAVTDSTGEVLGLFRMPDATIFSIDVAVAKARNVAYYANPAELQPIDQVPGVPAGTAISNRTVRYLAQPRFPVGIDGAPPGPFSVLNDGEASLIDGTQVGPPLPASSHQSVLGYDAFNPQTNFHSTSNILNQNGIVFFPGSAPVYKVVDGESQPRLVGGLGVSGDGVDQDDVVTAASQAGFDVPRFVLRADQVFVWGVRLPYQKFNRHPEG